MALFWLLSCFTLVGTNFVSGAPASEPELSVVPRIINGEEARPGSWPWHVSLQSPSRIHYCGGSLIYRNWVITSAHCNIAKHDLVVAGQYDRQSQDNIQILKIAKIFIHPHYNPLNNYADLALVKLTSQADFHLTVVSPVLLPSVDDKFHVRSSCRIMGWGVTRFNRTIMPVKLQEATVYLQTNEVCRNYWGPDLPQEMICVGAKGISPYHGDSGGSLVCMKYGVWTLVGILTCVDETRPTDVPVVAVRIPKFIPWVEDIVAHN